ncbi:TIR domain containing protein, partial [Massilia cavernae]
MAIRYGCFFSYAHGRYELMNRFKTALSDAIRCYLEPYFDNENELFIDT